MGVLCPVPEKAARRLELMITGQCSTGGALPVVDPFHHSPGKMPAPEKYRSDDCLWLFNAIPEYVKETGDMDFYFKILPYADKGEDTVLRHLKKALEFNLNLTGQHNLPCVMLSDWNDCIGLGYKGESLFTAMQVCYGLKEYIDICTRLDKSSEAEWAERKLADLKKIIRTTGWDGNWFIRGINENGEIHGSQHSQSAHIFLNPQCWSVLSGAGTREQGKTAMDSVYKQLNTSYGIMLLAPPFKAVNGKAVGASIYNDGQKENAGIFCHPQGWAVMAEALIGRGGRAYEYFSNFMPARMNGIAEIRHIEPYVYCQSTHSKFSKRFGLSSIPWLTGTASWAYYSATHYILGIRPEYDGLTIDPCIPAKWKGFRVRRIFRGKRLDISIDNSAGVEKGVKEIHINNETIKGTTIHIKNMGDHNDVCVVMG
jgi:cellobiose phosphorylase